MTWKIKDDVVIINGKDEFKHVPKTTPAKVTATSSLSHLN